MHKGSIKVGPMFQWSFKNVYCLRYRIEKCKQLQLFQLLSSQFLSGIKTNMMGSVIKIKTSEQECGPNRHHVNLRQHSVGD